MHAQACSTLCRPTDCRPLGSSVHGIFQARLLEWVAISYSRGSSEPRDQTRVSRISCTSRQILYHCATGKPHHSREVKQWKSLSCVRLFVTPWAIQSMEFSRPPESNYSYHVCISFSVLADMQPQVIAKGLSKCGPSYTPS